MIFRLAIFAVRKFSNFERFLGNKWVMASCVVVIVFVVISDREYNQIQLQYVHERNIDFHGRYFLENYYNFTS